MPSSRFYQRLSESSRRERIVWVSFSIDSEGTQLFRETNEFIINKDRLSIKDIKNIHKELQSRYKDQVSIISWKILEKE